MKNEMTLTRNTSTKDKSRRRIMNALMAFKAPLSAEAPCRQRSKLSVAPNNVACVHFPGQTATCQARSECCNPGKGSRRQASSHLRWHPTACADGITRVPCTAWTSLKLLSQAFPALPLTWMQPAKMSLIGGLTFLSQTRAPSAPPSWSPAKEEPGGHRIHNRIFSLRLLILFARWKNAPGACGGSHA